MGVECEDTLATAAVGGFVMEAKAGDRQKWETETYAGVQGLYVAGIHNLSFPATYKHVVPTRALLLPQVEANPQSCIRTQPAFNPPLPIRHSTGERPCPLFAGPSSRDTARCSMTLPLTFCRPVWWLSSRARADESGMGAGGPAATPTPALLLVVVVAVVLSSDCCCCCCWCIAWEGGDSLLLSRAPPPAPLPLLLLLPPLPLLPPPSCQACVDQGRSARSSR